MLLDARDLPDDQALDAAICIVGAGAAGIALALDFAQAGNDVLLLESGGAAADRATQGLYAGTVENAALHSPPDTYRQRRLGGSTTIWGGRCVPLDPIDFEQRSWIPHSGWPIDYRDLLTYYGRANRLCEAGPFAYRAGDAFTEPLPPMIGGFSSEVFSTTSLERFSCPTDFGRRYGAALREAGGVRLVLHANVTALHLNAAGTHVEQAMVRTLTGRALPVRARHFVLATGGLEVTRLLLASRDVQPDGIGNDHGVLGRYYMCHLAGTIGSIAFARPETVWHGYDLDGDVYCRRRLALTPDAQRRLHLGNFVARLHHPRITDPAHRTGLLSLLYLARAFIPYEYGKRLHGEETADLRTLLRHVYNVASDPFGTAGFLLHWLRYRTLPQRKFPSIIIRSRAGLYSLDFHAEQEPNPSSRVQLGSERDALGMPRLHIDWRYTAGDVHTVRRSIELLAADLGRSGVARFDYDPDSVEAEMTRYGAYGGHHIGTARMGTDPHSSVVDPDCRVHGVDNLYVASSAVFPTSGQANPTLTIVALALRLGDHLRRQEGRLPALANIGLAREAA